MLEPQHRKFYYILYHTGNPMKILDPTGNLPQSNLCTEQPSNTMFQDKQNNRGGGTVNK